jgi:hypothetical protein
MTQRRKFWKNLTSFVPRPGFVVWFVAGIVISVALYCGGCLFMRMIGRPGY